MSWGRRAALRCAGLFLGLLAGLALAETGLRVLNVAIDNPSGFAAGSYLLVQRSQRRITYECFPSNPHGEMRPLPDIYSGEWALLHFGIAATPVELPLSRLADRPWCIEMNRSSLSIRDREYAPEPAPGVVRILGVGDSFAAGVGVPIERTMFKRLERALGAGYEVINCAIPSQDSADELKSLTYFAGKLKATRALVVFLPNDVAITPALAQRQCRINGIPDDWFQGAPPGPQTRWRLLQLFRNRAAVHRMRRENIRWYLDCYDESHNGDNLAALAADFRGLAQLPDCKPALILHPILEGLLETDYPFAPIYAKVSAMASAAGLPVLDLCPVFVGKVSDSLWVHQIDHHPNGMAHDIAAKATLNWLRTEQPEFLEATPGR